jgi:DNA-binding NarL/FixJ family response regulator
MRRTRVVVRCRDEIVLAGLTSILQRDSGVETVPAGTSGDVDVTLAVADESASDTVELLREVAEERRSRVVLVTGKPLGDAEVIAVIELGVVVILPRRDVTAERLPRILMSAALGHGSMPSPQLGTLLKSIQSSFREKERGRSRADQTLAQRERDVIKLLADGLDTSEVAAALHFSERTVKNVIHGALRRLNLNNRTHLVAHSISNRLI